MKNMLDNIKDCMKLRQESLKQSFQLDEMNPINQDSWNIYPPPPAQTWEKPKIPAKEKETTIEFNLEECIIPETHHYEFKMNECSVFEVFDPSNMDKPIYKVDDIKQHYQKLDFILSVVADGPSKSFCFRRLRYLESKYQMYLLQNEFQELAESKSVPHRDFYNVRKVDTHVHHSASMNQKHLLRFIKYKLKTSKDEKVIFRDGKNLTLNEVFESLNLTAYDLNIDTLDMHAHKDSFHRFDKFNLKYNPLGESRLREIFLKTDNFINGKYLAELTKEVVHDMEQSKYQMAEYRLSIYGRNENEWSKLAAWIVDNKLIFNNVRWIIQVPRLYNIYKESSTIENFQQIISNIFKPLFNVTKNPNIDKKLHIFLSRVVGFDSVDDESKPEKRIHKKYPKPKDWSYKMNPPYTYYIYFMYANICSLNGFRRERGFSTFMLRPHCGEAGDIEHLASAYLTSYGISHGILLRKAPVLQYLYYLNQIPMAMSPLSNNALFLAYERNPFYTYFTRGLNVSLSTDDPLQFHFTKEPLIEEYSVAAQIWKLSPTDMCEISRNSVLQSGFELSIKKRWIGVNCDKKGPDGNDVHRTNVPNRRLKFRHDTLNEEFEILDSFTFLQ